jgi:hypothetical protein
LAAFATILLPSLWTPPRPVTAEPSPRHKRRAWLMTGVIVLFLVAVAVTMAVVHVRAVNLLLAEGVFLPRRWQQRALPAFSVIFAIGVVALWWGERRRWRKATADQPTDRA